MLAQKDYDQGMLEGLLDNIKEDRTYLDLLFDYMLILVIRQEKCVKTKFIRQEKCDKFWLFVKKSVSRCSMTPYIDQGQVAEAIYHS